MIIAFGEEILTGEQATINTIAFCVRIKKAGYEPMGWKADYLVMSQIEQYTKWYADYEKIPQTPMISRSGSIVKREMWMV